MDGIKYDFKSKELFQLAITHSSYSNEHKLGALASYERLEFLGDAVLDAVISEKIFEDYPELSEGDMTRMRASLVCEPMLAKKARELSLDGMIKMGRGESQSGGCAKYSILCDVFEAMVGAIFLDGGYNAAKDFVLKNFMSEIAEQRESVNITDPKSFLQEEIQKYSREAIIYSLVSEVGPDHDKSFVVEVSHAGKTIGRGSGKSKKEAEQNSAYNAIKSMKFNVK